MAMMSASWMRWTLLLLSGGAVGAGCIEEAPTLGSLADSVSADGDREDTGHGRDGDVAGGLARPERVVVSPKADSTGLEVKFDAVEGAEDYVIFRCEGECDREGDYQELAGAEGALRCTTGAERTCLFHDPEPGGAAPLGAPHDVTASNDLAQGVEVRWLPVPAAQAPRYTYQVVAVDGASRSEPSAPVMGHRPDVVVAGYEVQGIEGSTKWEEVEGLVVGPGERLGWVDGAAPPAQVTVNAVTASEGTYPRTVELRIKLEGGTTGVVEVRHGVTYRLRAVGSDGVVGPESAPVTGIRAAGGFTYQWYRSMNSDGSDAVDISGATGRVAGDPSAPPGGVAYYAVAVTAPGLEGPAWSAWVKGFAMPLPNKPDVTASQDDPSKITLRWEHVPWATRYEVWRKNNGDGWEPVEPGVCSVEGLCEAQDADVPPPEPESWAAPLLELEPVDPGEDSGSVWVGVTLPEAPTGAVQTYRVDAINSAGTSSSNEAIGFTRALPLDTIAWSAGTEEGGIVSSGILDLSMGARPFAVANLPLNVIVSGELVASQATTTAGVELWWEDAPFVEPAPEVTITAVGRRGGGDVTPAATAAFTRPVADLVRSWERKKGSNFELISVTWDPGTGRWLDGGASWLGLGETYRVKLSSPGATAVYTNDADGARRVP